MNRTRIRNGLVVAMALAAATVGAKSSFAADVYLVASRFDKTISLPGGRATTTTVPMWGFAEVTAADFATSVGTPTVPGPRIVVPPGDTTVTIHLRNTLPVPISIVIPGQNGSIEAVPATGRARSWAAETPPDGQLTYTFSNVRPGTYLYHSGTHAAVQVQMGLYGAMTKDYAANAAYQGTPAYDTDLLIVLSEIDPALHDAVATGQYAGIPASVGGTVPTGPMTSTIDYLPRLFLVNGEAHPAPALPSPAPSPLPPHVLQAGVGQSVLLRFVNAGLRSHAPSLLPDTTSAGTSAASAPTVRLIAEDGNPGAPWRTSAPTQPYAKLQNRALLPAGKTLDALWVPAAVGRYPLYDRMLNLTSDGATGGGMLTYVQVGVAGNAAPVAVDDTASSTGGASVQVAVLANDSDADGSLNPTTVTIVSPPSRRGTATVDPATGVVTYTPYPNFRGTETFTYTVNDNLGSTSNVARVVVTVAR